MKKRESRGHETSAPTIAQKSLLTKMRGHLVMFLVLMVFTAMAIWTSTSSGNATKQGPTSSSQAKGQEKPSGANKISKEKPSKEKPSLTTDKGSYLAEEVVTITGANWVPGEAVTIVISAVESKEKTTLQVTADKSGAFTVTSAMPDARSDRDKGPEVERKALFVNESDAEEDRWIYTATATGASSRAKAQARFSASEADHDGERLLEQETYWIHRRGYPTGRVDPAWVRQAAEQDARVPRGIPAGRKISTELLRNSPLALNPNAFTALGPQPLRMTGCSGCFDYATTEGRVNAIAVDPTTTTNGSIVAYIATVGGGVWKTTNCCSSTTSWTSLNDDALISTTSVDSVVIDPNNHNTIYAGTGDLNYGSFSMGSQGILKSIDGGATWTVLGANIFGAALPVPIGQFPQYQAVGKVRVDPNNSNNVVAGTKTGLYMSYDGGTNWTGPCLTNSFNTQRQDITGLELTNVGGTTRIIAAVGVRGFATTVQFNLDQNGANGIYKGTMPASGCPSDFAPITTNANGFVFGTAVTGSPYATGGNMNATTGTPYGGNITTGNQLGRIDIAVAPSNPNYIYAQVGSIVANNNAGCGNAAGCQLGVWASTDAGTSWTFMTGSAGGSLRNCAGGNTSGNPGDYPQNWYDQGMAVDPNNPDRVYIDTYDTWLATRTGTSFYNVTCGYNGSAASAHVVHVDHHALAFVPGSSSILLEGSDGGIFSTSNADAAVSGVLRPTWVNMDTGINTIEFYSGDISGNFATSPTPQANGGAQDNGSMSVTFTGSPTGPVQWQMGRGGDGFTARIDPVGTGTSLRMWQGNNSGSLGRCIANCTASGATWTTKTGGWTGDTQSFILPYDLFHGGIPGGDDCGAAGAGTGCGHLIAATTRVWETITGAASGTGGTVTWVITNNPTTQNLTKGTLGNRSFINQVKYSPKFQSVAIVGTNDGNVQIGFNLGTGVAAQGNWVNVTDNNNILPNRPVLGIALDPTVAAANVPVGYAAVGGFDQNTPTTPGHVFRVACTANCASFTWLNKSGNLPNIPVDSIIVNPNFPQQVFAGSDIGLYYTDDINAATPVWQRFNNGLPNVMIWDMQIDRGSTTLSLWTRSRGAFVWPLPQGRVNPLSQTITVNVHAPASAVHGSMFTVAATSDSGLPVTYSSSGACTNSGPTFTMTSGTGTCTVKYDQAGDANYAPATQVVEMVNAQECVGTNVALASFGATATASSQYSTSFPASGAIDGEHNGNNWGAGGGWNDGTRASYPDDVQVNFNINQTIGEIDVYTLKDQFNNGSVVTDTTTFSRYGITDFNVQYWTGSAWADVPGGAVTGNNLVKRKFIFPDITTDKIRVLVNGSADSLFSRVIEIEAFACNPVPVPPPPPLPCTSPGNNVARSTNGSTAVASSTVNANFPAAGAIDGEHDGNTWGAGGGWNDGTRGVFPDNVQVNFNVNQTLQEIDVYTLKDGFNNGTIVTDATTFSRYGITDFNLQYWTGSAWADVPGGAVTGNNLVKRKFIFPSLTTDKIRVVVNASADGLYSRVVEIEAFSCTPVIVRCVNSGGTGGCFSSIQAAINAANTGDVISVAAGTYSENLTLPKSVTLRGAQAGVNACGRSASESTVSAGSGTLLTLQTGSAGAVIDGFTFSGGARGIESTSGPLNNLQILNNRIIGFTGSGVFLNDPGTDITVSQNSIDGASKTGAGDLFHLDTDAFPGFRFTNNCVNGKGATDTSTGFFVDGNHNVNATSRAPQINGNSIANCQTGMNLGTRAFTGGTINGNTFSGNLFDGLQGGIQLSTISGNTFTGNGRSGLALTSFGNTGADRGAQNTTVTCNTFTGNGFTNNSGGTAGGGITYSAAQAAGTIATNHTNQNNISGNFVGARYTGTETIDAENNWWGSATGPTIASNPSGTGDTIADTNGVIDYNPFLTSAAGCAPVVAASANRPASGTSAASIASFTNSPLLRYFGSSLTSFNFKPAP